MQKTKLSRLRGLLLGGAAGLALAASAAAADRQADAAGAKAIADFVAAYGGAAALQTIKIKPEGASYLVSFDLAAATAALKSAGVTYDPAEVTFRVFQQGDGGWRVEQASMPPISAHVEPPQKPGAKLDMRVEATNFSQKLVIDPKLSWVGPAEGGADKLSMVQRGPGIDEFFEIGGLKFSSSTSSAASGLTTTATEPFAKLNFVVDVDPSAADPAANAAGKPVHVSAQGEGGEILVALKDFQPGPLLEAWKFAVAHPQRADVARDSAALKSVVTAAVADSFALDEAVKLGKLSVTSEVGPIAVEGVAFSAGIVNGGANTGFSEHFAARSIKLPEGLLPPNYAPLIPTSFDFGFKATGFDIAAAAQEWLANAKFEGDDPPLSAEAQGKVMAKLIGSRPILVELPPAHVVGPSLDLQFEGKVTVENAQPTGAVTVTLHNFDKTAQAIHGLGPQAEKQLVPVVAMVKGLGKPGPNGALVWVCEMGRDKVMKVNGLPLGKSPL